MLLEVYLMIVVTTFITLAIKAFRNPLKHEIANTMDGMPITMYTTIELIVYAIMSFTVIFGLSIVCDYEKLQKRILAKAKEEANG